MSTRPIATHARIVTASFAAAIACVLVPGAAERATAQPAGAFDVVREWTHVSAPGDRFRFENGVLRVEGGGGWLRGERRLTDFTLTAELRFLTEDADSGIFVRVEPGPEFGPGWPGDSYQVQLRNPVGESPFPPVGGLFRHGTRGGTTRFDEAAARSAFTGTGEWQTLVVRVAGDMLSVELNGTAVTEADGIANASGLIGLQSETGVLEIRSLEIAPH